MNADDELLARRRLRGDTAAVIFALCRALAAMTIYVPLALLALAIRFKNRNHTWVSANSSVFVHLHEVGSITIQPENFGETWAWMQHQPRLRSMRIDDLVIPWWLEPVLRSAVRVAARTWASRMVLPELEKEPPAPPKELPGPASLDAMHVQLQNLRMSAMGLRISKLECDLASLSTETKSAPQIHPGWSVAGWSVAPIESSDPPPTPKQCVATPSVSKPCEDARGMMITAALSMLKK